MSRIFSQEIQSVTGRNPRRYPAAAFKTKMIGYVTPEVDEWRLPLLRYLLDQRRDFHTCGEDTSKVDGVSQAPTIS